MSGLPLSEDAGGGRYPGLDVMSQARHWDAATRRVVEARLREPGPLRFFDEKEAATAKALLRRLLDQSEDEHLRLPLVHLVDERLADGRTDGWSYADLPEDAQAWQETLAALDADARERHGHVFDELRGEQQDALLEEVRTAERWRGFPADEVWGLWTRYACTAFYSHPSAWNEIGFTGPAYPRGYKRLGVDALEPYEVPDARPAQDPVRPGRARTAERAPGSGDATGTSEVRP